MESLSYEYAIFLAKVLTVLACILIILIAASALKNTQSSREQGKLKVLKLNESYKNLELQLRSAMLTKKELKKTTKEEKTDRKQTINTRVFVLDFNGDIKASAVQELRHCISALLSSATSNDEVVVRLESAGGMVHAYGLAASQLIRIRQAGIPLTICVDKVAASGGYMMACIGNKIISAPFAILGSIGVVAQLPNVHKLLKKNDIDFELFTAGEYKRTLTVFGENTQKGREKFQEDLDTTHQLFKEFVVSHRPNLLIDKIATGEVWLGSQALNHGLVDELKTSDEYLLQRSKEADVFQVSYVEKKPITQKISMLVANTLEQSLTKVLSKINEQRFW
ncbi:inner membrane peptidase [Azomonas agilis]|uniref:Inner membrane peptidase n=1 Tax=Azomonas agilis TaxID=116849 RepID=A0A562IY19_9GAMM|nr:protease SohB [Azomonas agilis]TWH75786.1 inner membrane peptidase [Azomonas agilis]